MQTHLKLAYDVAHQTDESLVHFFFLEVPQYVWFLVSAILFKVLYLATATSPEKFLLQTRLWEIPRKLIRILIIIKYKHCISHWSLLLSMSWMTNYRHCIILKEICMFWYYPLCYKWLSFFMKLLLLQYLFRSFPNNYLYKGLRNLLWNSLVLVNTCLCLSSPMFTKHIPCSQKNHRKEAK